MNSTLLTILTTVASISIGAIITLALVKRKTPRCCVKVNSLFTKGVAVVDELQITYQGNSVNNLCSVYIAFWNRGTETIRNEDIAEDILVVAPDGSRICSAEVVKRTDEANQFDVELCDENKCKIDFKYLDHQQGAVIQLFCDLDPDGEIQILGTIIGAKEIKSLKLNTDSNRSLKRSFNSILLLVALIALIIAIVEGRHIDQNDLRMYWVAVSYLSICAFVSSINLMSEAAWKIPKSLRKLFW